MDPKWLGKMDPDIAMHTRVCTEGYPNRWGARLPVPTKWNLGKFSELLGEYEDKEMVEWLKYSWPTGRLPTLKPPGQSTKNHKGATDFPQHLKAYIVKDQKYQVVMGPFEKIPFTGNVGISPLSTRPKKGSADRRVILDLSFPIGDAVNDGIPKDSYLGFAAKLTFPKTDDFAVRIFYWAKAVLCSRLT